MTVMMDLLRDLTPLNRVICSTDFDRTVEYVTGLLPCEVYEYPETLEHNGWTVPPTWDVVEATISKDGQLVYDGTWHPLAVIALSAPFEGRVSREELRDHLHYDHRYPDSLTFHFRGLFRRWDRDWGFCVPKELFDALEPGEYDVRIVTREAPGVMKAVIASHRGVLPYTISFCTNLDHPGVSNDGLSGVAVGVELMRRLQGRETLFTYQLLMAPGILGTEYFLGTSTAVDRERIIACVCLWMLGSRTELALQASRSGDSAIESAIADALEARHIPFRRGEFETIIINDEYLWEAYDIPACSLSRFPYPEYHSSRDDLSIMDEAKLGEAVEVLLDAVDRLEATPVVEKQFEGTVCLSNPRYDLYVDPGQISFGERVAAEQRALRMLQDYVPSIRGPVTVRSLAERFQLSDEAVLDYLRNWAEKGLLTLWERRARET